MQKLVFATNNSHKLIEIRQILYPDYEVMGLKEIGIVEEIPEDHFTLEENALQKARFIHKKIGISCFADDTGLEVTGLSGEPGVFSARYSRIGEPTYPDMDVVAGNIRKLLEKLEGITDRSARFRTVVALILNGEEYLFDGIVEGNIIEAQKGSKGFGYDPVFRPTGFSETFAEMEISIKNSISHRARAVKKLSNFLKNLHA